MPSVKNARQALNHHRLDDEQVGTEYAKERAALFAKKTLESLCSNRHIVVLGDFQTPRLPIFSFLVRVHGMDVWTSPLPPSFP